MLTQIVMNANVMQSLQSLGHSLTSRLFRTSGWKIPDDTDTGISFGEFVDVGGGYMEMDVLDLRTGAKYEIRGAYAEAGFGIGEISKAQAWINKIVKMMPKGMRPSSDVVAMPGGGITQFIMGPMQDRGSLEPQDFKRSSWVYVHIGAEIAVLAGDLGLMFMVDQATAANLIATSAPGAGGALTALMVGCLAWSPYYGTSLGLGAGGKFAVRIIQTVQMNSA
jgi:hypothetical protein